MYTIIAVILVIVALWCAFNWGCGFYICIHERLGEDDLRWSAISENMFHHGICGIVALGFAGVILACGI
jgi:hypothetical protein